MSRVHLDHISKTYAALKVIEDVTLEIPHGQFLAILGPSGCGKSTLLRIIAGLVDQSGGRVLIGDRDVSELSPARRGVAMVFQSYALYPHLTVEGNLSLGLKRARLPKPEIERRVNEAVRVLQLEALLKRRPAQLSGGQRQRVAIGRAIVREPEAFLFDEPLSNLDAALRIQVRTELADLHRRLGSTMIYVTHDQVEAMTLAQRIVVMNGGVVQQVGTPQELYRTPANLFVAGFIGTPGMNLLPGRTTAEGIDLGSAGQFGWSGPAGRDVVVGVRPSDFGAPARTGQGFAATLLSSEYLGDESILRARLDDGAVVQIVERPDHDWKAGDTLRVPVARFHVFDAATRQRIGGSTEERQVG